MTNPRKRLYEKLSDLRTLMPFSEGKADQVMWMLAERLEPFLVSDGEISAFRAEVLDTFEPYTNAKPFVILAKRIHEQTWGDAVKAEETEYLTSVCSCGESDLGAGIVKEGERFVRCSCPAGRRVPLVWLQELNHRAQKGIQDPLQ